MRVIIDKQVDTIIREFYTEALRLHPTLDSQTIILKIHRLYDSLEILGRFPHIYAVAQFRDEWKEKEYRVLVCEDFLFAYKVYDDPTTGTQYVYIHDAVHSLLYHD